MELTSQVTMMLFDASSPTRRVAIQTMIVYVIPADKVAEFKAKFDTPGRFEWRPLETYTLSEV